MKDNVTNKYLNVFQNYDEFSSESFNYIKGNDYVAFLINENQVIYWINLEVIWKLLGITVTDTGEKTENGDSIVNVVLNGNNNIIYNYLPAIPDEERIKSLTRFCDNYPYIENIKLDNTINLENIDYAFRNLTLNSFSLNVSKVKTANYAFQNTTINCDILLDFKNNDVNTGYIFNNVICKNNTLTINFNDDAYHNMYYNFNFAYSIYKIVSNKNISLYISINGINNYIEANNVNIILPNNAPSINTDNNYIQNINCNECNIEIPTNVNTVYYNASIICNKLIIDSDIRTTYPKNSTYKIDVVDVKDIYISTIYSDNFNAALSILGKGSNIQINKSNIHIINKGGSDVINGLMFKQPIVNDEFLKIINNKINLIQYKDDFENISDIELYDTNYKDLCFLDNYTIQEFNSIIIKNGYVPIFFYNGNPTIQYLDIDTTNAYQNKSVDEYPTFNVGYNEINVINGGYKGYYKLDAARYNQYLQYKLLINCTIYAPIEIILIFDKPNTEFNNNLFDNKNKIINFIPLNEDTKNYISIRVSNFTLNKIYKDFDITSFIYNNTLNIYFQENIVIFKYVDGIECYPTNLLQYIRYIHDSNKIRDVYYFTNVDDRTLITENDDEFSSITDAYLNFTEGVNIVFSNNYNYRYYCNIINLYGNINVDMQMMQSEQYAINLNFVHIDFANIIGSNINFKYIPNLNEVSIKKIPNALEDNSSTEEEQKTTKIISVYRSQYNYWGANDVSIIISKNYEIAITEN